jgi:sn-glycerol 3-phosphate transport system permease protein
VVAVAEDVLSDDLQLSESEYRQAASRYRRRRSLRAYGFVAPYLVPFLLFMLIPVGWSIWLSFNQGGLVDAPKFVGLTNWRQIASDGELKQSAENTAIYAVEAIFLVFTLAIFLASVLNRYRKFGNLFKLTLYFPLLAPAVLVGLIWQFMTNYDFGLLNLTFTKVGIDKVNFFGNGTTALLVIVAAEVWRGLGFWTLYFLASLQSIPGELIDASRVDGARGYRRFVRVTLPLLRPLLLFAIVVAIIANFQVFDTVYILTAGGPANATSTVVWFIWKRLFLFQDTGQAYAASVGLLLAILLLTGIAFGLLGGRRRRRSA